MAERGDQPVLYLAVRIEVQQHPVPSTAPALETVFITVTPGCFLTNLTRWPLQVAPLGAFPPTDTLLVGSPGYLTEDDSLPSRIVPILVSCFLLFGKKQ